MDRRLRSPVRRPAAPPRADERQRAGSLHRFLRPGALARLRDSKIVERSLRTAASAAALPASSSSLSAPRSPAPAAAPADGVPCFLGAAAAARGMRYPLRKKLAAARSVVFLPPPPQHEAVEVFLDGFAAALSDLLAAH